MIGNELLQKEQEISGEQEMYDYDDIDDLVVQKFDLSLYFITFYQYITINSYNVLILETLFLKYGIYCLMLQPIVAVKCKMCNLLLLAHELHRNLSIVLVLY